MKWAVSFLLGVLGFKCYSQTFSIVRTEYNVGKALSIEVKYDTGASRLYWSSCYFGGMPKMTDSVKMCLIEDLLQHQLNDTSGCFKPVEALSYRFQGRNNRVPQSSRYNLQIEALVLINYIVLSSEAVSYSPFPVIYDKQKKKEITTSGKEVDAVIKCYMDWFDRIKRTGLKQYDLPMISNKYEWYGSLYQKQRLFKQAPEWSALYNCPELVREED